tara:strand:- start:3876 stop:4550 length:675 start_codon:yes stop_codon:yes gene_type:complete
MIIVCPQCNTKYSLSVKALGLKGKRVKCSNCGNEWFQKKEIYKEESKKVIKEKIINKVHIDEKNVEKVLFSEKPKKKRYKLLFISFISIIFLLFYLAKDNYKFFIKEFFSFIEAEKFLINKEENEFTNLLINQIEKEISILNDDRKVIKIYGKISNTSNINKKDVPKLKATLFDNKNNVLNFWTFSAEQGSLNPEESINFVTSFIYDDIEIDDIKIEFYNDVDE